MAPEDDTPTYDITGVDPDPVAVAHAAVRVDNATEGGDAQ
jgi:hypothetical protein